MVSLLQKNIWDPYALNKHAEIDNSVMLDDIVVAAGENENLQDPASSRLCKVRLCL